MTDRRRRPEGGGRPRRRRSHHGVAAALALLVLISPARAFARCEPRALPRDAPTALVLSGGGAKGVWEAGVAGALGAIPTPMPFPEIYMAATVTCVRPYPFVARRCRFT